MPNERASLPAARGRTASLDGIDRQAGDVTERHAQLAAAVETHATYAVATVQHPAAMAAGEAADGLVVFAPHERRVGGRGVLREQRFSETMRGVV